MVPCGRFGRKSRQSRLSKIGSAGQACFESPQSMKRDFQAFKNRTAVTKEERPRQRKNCAAIDKDKAARPSNDNFLITVRRFGSFVPWLRYCSLRKGLIPCQKRRANGEGEHPKAKGRSMGGPVHSRSRSRNWQGHHQKRPRQDAGRSQGKAEKKAIEENVGIDYGRAKTYTVGSWLEVWMENYAKIKSCAHRPSKPPKAF